MKKILEFLSENFQFLMGKFSVYLNRRVFVMDMRQNIRKGTFCGVHPTKSRVSRYICAILLISVLSEPS